MDDISLKEFFDAILDEQRRGMLVAEREREKAAAALRDELARSITEGDRALRDHVEAQIFQIREASAAAEKLEAARVTDVKETIAGVQREIGIAFGAAQIAISKSEAAVDQKFHDANEWRAQSADREVSQRNQITELTSTYLPRESFDAFLARYEENREHTAKALTLAEGSRQGRSSFAGMIVGGFGLMLTVISIILIVGDVLTP